MHNMIRRFNCTAFFVVIFVVSAIYVVKIANVVRVESALIVNESTEDFGSVVVDPDGQLWTTVDDPIVIGDKMNHLMWFIQITDLHISIFKETSRIVQLKEFCMEDVVVIKPSVVLASGDLTHGQLANHYSSQQLEEEWKIYHDTVIDSGVTKVTKWLDVRGNHDNFDIPTVNSVENFFLKYSVQGINHTSSYSYEVIRGNDRYTFIAVDACPEPGSRRPFNFVGLLTHKDMDELASLEAYSQESNLTIWFGHYPTSSILSPSPGIRQLMKRAYAYLCGHFHTLGGWVPRMYTKQKTGFLELELGDWRDSRLYRVAAVDHGLLSLVDVRHGSWPIILITNPKNAVFLLGDREPVHRMIQSTHIRLLVFSTVNITEVSVRVDGGSWQPCVHVEGPLYVVPWRPEQYVYGLHEITVKAKDFLDRERLHSESFSLDGTRPAFDLLSRFILMCNLITIAQVCLGLSVCLTVLPLCYVRLLQHYVKVGKLARPRYRNSCGRSIMRKLWLVSSVDRIFYPVVLMTIYVPLGPWFVGNILHDHVGVCFAWGIFVNGFYLPGGFTFAFAFFHVWSFNVPLIILLSFTLDRRYSHLAEVPACPKTPSSVAVHSLRNIPFVVFLLLNSFFAFLTYPTFGGMAFLLNPLKTWSLLLAVVLWVLASRLPTSCFQSSLGVFPPYRRPPVIICQDVDKEISFPLQHATAGSM